jgi:putative chitinase
MKINHQIFYNTIRAKLNLTTEMVVGCEKHLDYIESHGLATNYAAYCLATSYWETSGTMHPIVERGSQKYLRSKKYWPYIGRGLIQPTWDYNYRKAAVLLGLPKEYFIEHMDDLLKWEYALPLLFNGMSVGLYTGKALNDYIDDVDESDAEDLKEYIAARRIVNGKDKATQIGELAITFEHGLRAAGYTIDSHSPVRIDPAITGEDNRVVIPATPITPIAPKPPTKTISDTGSKPSWIMLFVQAVVAVIRGLARRKDSK